MAEKDFQASLFKNEEFLSQDECTKFAQIAFSNAHLCIVRSSRYKFLGYPFDYASIYGGHNADMVDGHNQLIQSEFGELLERVRSYFEGYFQEKVVTQDGLSLPGFNFFEIPPCTLLDTFYHLDDHKKELATRFPLLRITPESPTLSFTILMNEPKDHSSGLTYFDRNDPIGRKAAGHKQENQKHYLGFSRLQIYKAGEINFHQNLLHSVYAKNNSQLKQTRLTFQGHLLKLDEGLLIFW
ncbi:MAG: hypothetical protein KC478_14270 [Bacteriovoracaceae bacterium]|nr:hypothetical protein [Bacteriovoracaceae bacterium]